MYEGVSQLSQRLKEAHAESWRALGAPGAFWSGGERRAMVLETRHALGCALCDQRASALSPSAIDGLHERATDLPEPAVDAIHRLRRDPGRLTRSWFDATSEALGVPEYIELVSVVTSSVIIDTLHNALGIDPPELPGAIPGNPTREQNTETVDIGAWVPVLDAPTTMADTGLPQVPNIARSLGLVPSALALFFQTFRPHYALKDIDLSISQAQAEFVASRTSAINECFY